MNRRRQIAVGFFSVVIVVVLVAIVYVATVNAGQTVPAFILSSDVGAGAKFDQTVAKAVSLKAAPGDFAITKYPANGTYQFRTPLQKGDIIRDDDLVPIDTQIPINVSVAGSPAIGVGDVIDVWALAPPAAGATPATPTATTPQLIGCEMPVIAAPAGNAVTILVSAKAADVASWIALTADPTVKLYANRARAGSGCQPSAFASTSDVLTYLERIATQPAPSTTPHP